jgi:hypothetical protein
MIKRSQEYNGFGSLLALLFAAIATAGTSAGPSLAAVHQPSVQVTQTDFDGWHGCERISNGIVEAVVVPQIGRIMAFQFVGRPESNALYVSADLAGKTTATSGQAGTTWLNYGGEKVWPSPQSEWPRYIGGTWPPDRAIDGDLYTIRPVAGGVELTSPQSSSFGLQIVRTITMEPGRHELHVNEAFKWLPAGTAHAGADAGKLGIWSVTQTRPDGTIFVPIRSDETGRFPSGFVTFDSMSRPIVDQPSLPTGWSRAKAALVGRRDPTKSHKIGAIDSSGWIGSLYDGTTVFTERFSTESSAQLQPDGGCRAEVYTGAGGAGYIELETLGPLQSPHPGSETRFQIDWRLTRLRSAPQSDSDAAMLVSAAAASLRKQ